MFANYLRVAYRNLVKNPLYSAINIAGLAVGLAACILISLFVRDEYSYDKHWEHADSIYRLNTTIAIPGREPFVTVVTQGPARAALQAYFGEELEAITRFQPMSPVIRYGDRAFAEDVHWTDPDTARMFDLEIIAGDIDQALGDNASLAVNESFAIKHFGTTDAVGEVVNIRSRELERDFRVGAVFRDLPHNTVLDFQVLAMIDEDDWVHAPELFTSWFSVNNTLFFQLRKGSSIQRVSDQLNAFTDANIQIPRGAFADGEVRSSDYISYTAQPLRDIQLNPVGVGEMKPTGDKNQVALFAAIAALTLLIGCINFMNLATARSTQRAREVALRKVLGASRRQLVLQFLGESTLIALAGLLVGVVLVELVLPSYSAFLGKELALSYTSFATLGLLMALVAIVGLLGGVYPALVLSGFRPARVLKANRSMESSGSAALRSLLVIFQFTVSIALIVATTIVFGQMRYATSMDPGFNKDGLLAIEGTGRSGAAEQQSALIAELKAQDGVRVVSASSEMPFNTTEDNTSVRIPGNPEAGSILIGLLRVDYDFFDALGSRLIAGRSYSREYAIDRFPDSSDYRGDSQPAGNIIVNEAAVRRLGFGTPEQALGRGITISMGNADSDDVNGLLTIVGVVRDMNLQSLKSVIRPEVYFATDEPQSYLMLRYEGDPQRVVERTRSVWTSLFPDIPFEYAFVDEVAAEEFRQEQNVATMLGTFSLLAVVIACLGLYGLASFTAERRTKEIGIRRVLGAKISNIVGLLLWQFSKPVVLANLIAWPIACWSMLRWLENFPYRIDAWLLLPACLFAGAVALAISWLTVGGNAARVARRSPVEALRYE